MTQIPKKTTRYRQTLEDLRFCGPEAANSQRRQLRTGGGRRQPGVE